MSFFWKMSQCNTTFDLKINLGHSDLYLIVQWFPSLIFFALKNILVLLAKPDSGELRYLATALIVYIGIVWGYQSRTDPYGSAQNAIIPVVGNSEAITLITQYQLCFVYVIAASYQKEEELPSIDCGTDQQTVHHSTIHTFFKSW